MFVQQHSELEQLTSSAENLSLLTFIIVVRVIFQAAL